MEDYGPEEMVKLERLFEITGSLNGLRILDPGCGTGRLTEILSDRMWEKGHVVALAISPVMIDEAKRRTTARQNVEVNLCPVEDFSLKEKDFDIILCHQVFPHFVGKKRGSFSTLKYMNIKIISELNNIIFYDRDRL